MVETKTFIKISLLFKLPDANNNEHVGQHMWFRTNKIRVEITRTDEYVNMERYCITL